MEQRRVNRLNLFKNWSDVVGGGRDKRRIRGIGSSRENNAAVKGERTTVRNSVMRLFRDFGMTTIFGNPGSTELPIFSGFPKDFRYVLGLQERSRVGMADGFAQATRNAALR